MIPNPIVTAARAPCYSPSRSSDRTATPAPRPGRALSRCLGLLSLAALLGACAATPPAGDLASGVGAGSAIPGSRQDFIVNVGDRVFFEEDSSEITFTAQSTLDKQAQWLSRYAQGSFTIEGHADERGTREYNYGLGVRRAEAAKRYLVARGISQNRIRTISYGKDRPVATCNDVTCWSQNRRAVTVIPGG